MFSQVKFWIKDHWDTIVSTAGVALSILTLALLYFYGPRALNNFLLTRLDSETTGTVLTIDKNMVMHEDHLGGRVKVGGFTVTYRYDVEDSNYQKQEYVDRKSVDRNAELFLLYLNPGDTILVRYNPNDPSIARWFPKTNSDN